MVYLLYHLTELLGHPEFMSGGQLFAAQSAIALPIESVFWQHCDEFLVLSGQKAEKGVCG